ncbi:MAG TPA: hypothetical protein VFB49_05725 [Patescibacteria group bacterium]|nr:hypothetical protein [Patescibacteria group bacterium]
MTKQLLLTLALGATFLMLAAPAVRADDDDDEGDQAAVVKALPQAKVSLGQALLASAREGTPISAKFEVEDGKLQLSVYTMKADKYSEVIVDHMSGKVAKSEAITEGEDLEASKAQSAAMKGAKKSLAAALEAALKANPGYKAISVVPSLKEGHAMAEVTLAKGTEIKTVDEKLD